MKNDLKYSNSLFRKIDIVFTLGSRHKHLQNSVLLLLLPPKGHHPVTRNRTSSFLYFLPGPDIDYDKAKNASNYLFFPSIEKSYSTLKPPVPWRKTSRMDQVVDNQFLYLEVGPSFQG